MDKKKIDRINELGRIAKTRELTPEETEERQKLREEYIRFFRAGIRGELKGDNNNG
ncbi:MAG: DUF896 domain-containing protein [Clostridia bacterium]|nr:DUF896 domain-containing protein [Clostridia bacterium]